MFNEEQKYNYLSTLEDDDKKVASNMFKESEKYELIINKDISDFTAYQLTQFFDKDAKHFSIKRMWHQSYINYTEWSIKNKYINQKVLYEAKDKGRRKKTDDEGGNNSNIDTMVSGPKHLQKVLDSVYTPIDVANYSNNTISIIRRGIYWLLFCGVPIDNICNVTKDCVNISSRNICINDKKYYIYEEAIPTLKVLCEATTLTYEHAAYTSVLNRTGTSDSILRGFRDFSDKFINTNSRAIVKDFEEKQIPFLILDNAWKSGIFYRLYEEETSGTAVDLLLKDNTLLEQFGANSSNKADKRRYIAKKYESWKNKYKRV